MCVVENGEKLWQRYFNGPRKRDAKEKLILHYLPLVKYVAGRLAIKLPSHVDMDDLISCGVIGLINGIENFDPRYKTRFETYGIIRIRGAMIDELRSMDWVPRSMREKFCHLQKAYAVVEQESGRPATDTEVAEYMNISLDDLRSLLGGEKNVSMLSLNEVSVMDESGGKSIPMMDAIKDSKQPLPSDEAELNEKKLLVSKHIEELPPQEKLVITL
ncbi:MAG: sigma-70 family RNA polymerase sigma factor, partial [Thermoplasmata archaeon]|nr:sigma-70 family RNA polymerase sigma factor [Thermoplasmata archaeon]